MGLPHGDVVGFKDTTTESELMSALSPVSITIEVDLSFSQSYKTGPVLHMVPDRCTAVRVHRHPCRKRAITTTCETELDHGVLAVNYGTVLFSIALNTGVRTATRETELDHGVLAVFFFSVDECGLLSGTPSYPVVSCSPSLVFACPAPLAPLAHTPSYYWYCDSAKSMVM